MACRAFIPTRVFVVDDALPIAVAILVLLQLRRHAARPQRLVRIVRRVLHAPFLEENFRSQFIDTLAGNCSDDFAHDHETDVRIHGILSGLIRQSRGKHQFTTRDPICHMGMGHIEFQERRESRAMRHDVADRDGFPPGQLLLRPVQKLRKILIQRSMDVQFALVIQPHAKRRRANAFRDGRQIKQIVLFHLTVAFIRMAARRHPERRPVQMPCRQHGARCHFRRNPFVQFCLQFQHFHGCLPVNPLSETFPPSYFRGWRGASRLRLGKWRGASRLRLGMWRGASRLRLPTADCR